MFVDQVYFPGPAPILKLFLTRDSGVRIRKHLKIDEVVNRIFRYMSWRHIRVILRQALQQIRGYANVERAVMLARQNINAGLPFFSHGRIILAKWTLKQVQGDGLGKLGRTRHD